jgi:glyoxylase-like metal-dependent hydrolase (beta-lactamase superfamily II)
MTPDYNRHFDVPPGVPMALSSRVTRVLAPNPGPFTFRGTGVHFVGAGPEIAVIDPGPLLPAHLEALKAAIGGRRVSHILITHTHRDHSEAANALKAWSGAPTFGFGPQLHPSTGEEADDTSFMPDVRLQDGDVLRGDGFTLTALHTPGHAANHLCFALAEEKALFSGDHVMGWSSSVIAPPDGDMAAYMAGLERLIARHDTILYPTHGAPIENPGPYLRALLAHRRARETEVRAALERGPGSVAALVAAIYPGLDPVLHDAAALTVTAHLLKLESAGAVARDGKTWRISGPAA